MLTETKITAKIVSILRKEYYAQVLNICGGEYQSKGWPDLYIVHWKFVGFIECKGQKTVLEPLQIATMREIIKRGGVAYVLRFTYEKSWRLSNFNEEDILTEFNFNTYQEAVGTLLWHLNTLKTVKS
jgi:hypothetical protein